MGALRPVDGLPLHPLPKQWWHRHKRSIINADAKKLGSHHFQSIVHRHFSRFSAAILPAYGVITACRDIRSLALGLESIGNETADALTAVASEMKAIVMLRYAVCVVT